MKFAMLAAAALLALTGCCGLCRTKCYPYPLYDYSPAKVCGATAPCPPAPCAPVVR